jgi:hypothetical protein
MTLRGFKERIRVGGLFLLKRDVLVRVPLIRCLGGGARLCTRIGSKEMKPFILALEMFGRVNTVRVHVFE